jgi:hypothetical protein
MQEFSAISVSSYEAGTLADRLTEQSREGWSVVSIVPTGSSITAYLSRDGSGADRATPVATATDVTHHEVTQHDVQPEPEPAAAPSIPDSTAAYLPSSDVPAATPEPTPEPVAATDDASGWASGAGGSTDSGIMPESAHESAAVVTGSAAAATTETAAAGAAPAGWYADPSSRFELRYWDGAQWTEHVSRSGQQYTDPPVA